MTIRAVIFDLGHTVWDIGPSDDALDRAYVEMRETLTRRLKRDDLPEPRALKEAVRLALRAAGETYFMNAERLDQPASSTWIDEGCRALGVELDGQLLAEVTPPLFATEIDSLVCGEGTREALMQLAADGYEIGCVTNTLADGNAIRAMLRRHRLDDLMQSVVVSANEGWRKPHPSLFEKALSELDVRPTESLFVGDSPLHDIGGAKRVGMRAVLTQQYVSRPFAGIEPQPDAVIQHLRELPDVIAKLDRCG